MPSLNYMTPSLPFIQQSCERKKPAVRFTVGPTVYDLVPRTGLPIFLPADSSYPPVRKAMTKALAAYLYHDCLSITKPAKSFYLWFFLHKNVLCSSFPSQSPGFCCIWNHCWSSCLQLSCTPAWCLHSQARLHLWFQHSLRAAVANMLH